MQAVNMNAVAAVRPVARRASRASAQVRSGSGSGSSSARRLAPRSACACASVLAVGAAVARPRPNRAPCICPKLNADFSHAAGCSQRRAGQAHQLPGSGVRVAPRSFRGRAAGG